MPVQFFNEKIKYSFPHKRKTTALIMKILDKEKFLEGNVNIIFCNDEFLHEINQKYLGKDYFTDIITFNYNEGRTVSGDLFISLDRVKENAEIHGFPFSNELFRVIIHGILHLVGYDDQNLEQQKTMRAREDFYLNY